MRNFLFGIGQKALSGTTKATGITFTHTAIFAQTFKTKTFIPVPNNKLPQNLMEFY